jgi:hypothetical protein
MDLGEKNFVEERMTLEEHQGQGNEYLCHAKIKLPGSD